jgi:hypothetical protein
MTNNLNTEQIDTIAHALDERIDSIFDFMHDGDFDDFDECASLISALNAILDHLPFDESRRDNARRAAEQLAHYDSIR